MSQLARIIASLLAVPMLCCGGARIAEEVVSYQPLGSGPLEPRIETLPVERKQVVILFIPPSAPYPPLDKDYPFPQKIDYDEGNTIIRFRP